MRATYLKNTFKPADVEVFKVVDLLEKIKNGTYKSIINKIRNEKVSEERNKLKVNELSGVIWTGTFSYRDKGGILDSSGLAILDFDHVDSPETFRDSLKNDAWVYSAWISPSGDGVKALIRIPNVSDDIEYKEYYSAILEHYQQAKADTQTKDISRLCFNSYDSDLWINNLADVWDEKKIDVKDNRDLPDIPYYCNESETIDKLEKWITQKGEFYSQGNRNSYIYKLASACNRFGIFRGSCEGYFLSNYDLPEKEIRQSINSAYKHTNLHGTARFENKAEFAAVVSSVAAGESKKKVIKKIIDDGVNSSEAEQIYTKAVDAVNDKLETFWETSIKSNVVKLIPRVMKYVDWLNAAGFYKYYYSNNDYILVKVDRNIITETTADRVRAYVKKYVLSLPYQFDMITREELYEFIFVKQEKKYFGSATMELLNDLPINFVKDTKNKAFIYFKNTAVEITKNSITPFSYENMDGYIWKNQIIDRDFKEDVKDFEDFSFNKFMRNITGSETNYNSLRSITGYMLHGYKNPALSVAPILNDCILSEGLNGGTGKGLFVKSLGHIKPMITFDAKNWDINKSFAFQRVNLDTEILFIDDVQKGFDFEKLFSVITEGITVEKKNLAEFYISYQDSPKIIISTNYAINGEGNSHQRRRIEIEFVKHYHKDFSPADEFKQYFYTDWNSSQWAKFDMIMLDCIQYYLRDGLQESKLENLQLKKLISSTNEMFVEWVQDEETFQTNREYNLTHLFSDYVEYTGYKKMNVGYLGKLLKEYAKYLGLRYYKERRTVNSIKYTYVSIGEPYQQASEEVPY